MRGRRNPDQPEAANMYLPPCRVCGEKGSGFHYGVTTCGACKGFFTRSLVRMQPYTCMDSHLCKVGPSTNRRQSCPKCRYDKCIAVGMSKDACKVGRYSLVNKSKDIAEMRMFQDDDTDNPIDLDSSCSLQTVISSSPDVRDALSPTGTLPMDSYASKYSQMSHRRPQNADILKSPKECNTKLEISRSTSCFMQEVSPQIDPLCEFSHDSSEDGVYSDLETEDVYWYTNRNTTISTNDSVPTNGNILYMKMENCPPAYEMATTSSFLEAGPPMLDSFTHNLGLNTFSSMFPRNQDSNYMLLESAKHQQSSCSSCKSDISDVFLSPASNCNLDDKVTSSGNTSVRSANTLIPFEHTQQMASQFCGSPPIVQSSNPSCEYSLHSVSSPFYNSHHHMSTTDKERGYNPNLLFHQTSPHFSSQSPVNCPNESPISSSSSAPQHQAPSIECSYPSPAPNSRHGNYSIDELIAQSINTDGWTEPQWFNGCDHKNGHNQNPLDQQVNQNGRGADQRTEQNNPNLIYQGTDPIVSSIEEQHNETGCTATNELHQNGAHTMDQQTTQNNNNNNIKQCPSDIFSNATSHIFSSNFLAIDSSHNSIQNVDCGASPTPEQEDCIFPRNDSDNNSPPMKRKYLSSLEKDANRGALVKYDSEFALKNRCLQKIKSGEDFRRKSVENEEDINNVDVIPVSESPFSFFIMFICPELATHGLSGLENFPFLSFEQHCLRPFLNSCVDTGDAMNRMSTSEADLKKFRRKQSQASTFFNCDEDSTYIISLGDDFNESPLKKILNNESRLQISDEDMEVTISNLMESHERIFGMTTNSMTDSDIKSAQDVYKNVCTLRDRIYGPPKFIGINSYTTILSQTGIDVDNRRDFVRMHAGRLNDQMPRMVRFYRSVPGFQSLPIADRMTLVKDVINEYFLLSSYRGFDPISDVLLNLEYMCATRISVWQSMFLSASTTRNMIHKTLYQLQNLKLTKEELVFLKVFSLTRAHHNNQIQDCKAVDKLHHHFRKCLVYHLRLHHPNPEKRFAELMSVFTMMGQASQVCCTQWAENQSLYIRLLDKHPVPYVKEFFSRGSPNGKDTIGEDADVKPN